MKNKVLLLLLATILIASQACTKVENDDLKIVPEGMHLLSHINTHYHGHTVVDSFYYNTNFDIEKMVRHDGELQTSFYFKNKRLSERSVVIKHDDQEVSYNISYMNDGKLSVSNDTSAYVLSDALAGNLYTKLICYSREPFAEWDVEYSCEFNWEDGNLISACVDRMLTHYQYDNKPNPMAGYRVWGFFYDDLFLGSTNNRIQSEYHYEYDEYSYPSRLTTPGFYREYFYY